MALAGHSSASDDATSSAAYLAGLESLAAGNVRQAAADFTRALAAKEGNADYLRARGVALTLAENFPAAIADLQRALRLQADDRDTRLWLAAACLMSGDPATGANYFSFAGLPHEYAELVYNQLALDYWSSRERGSVYDREQRRQVAVSGPVKKLFPDAARLYAERHKAIGPEVTALVARRIQAALHRGDWAAALPDLRALRAAAPDDPALRRQWAGCLLGLGDAYHARTEFTHALCLEPEWAEGYQGRAQAAASLGAVRRAGSDLEAAAALGVRIAPLPAKPPMADAGALEQFWQDLRADKPAAVLVDQACALHRGFNARRRLYDEEYQDRLWALTDAIRHDARTSLRHEALAGFLFNHRVVPTIWNGPRASEQLRPQSRAEYAQELQRALAAADVALKLDDRNANALAVKARVYCALGRSNAAEPLVDRGLELDRQNFRLLKLKVQLLLDHAAQLAGQASALRAGHTDVRTEHRSDGVYEVRTHYPPTATQLAEASACEVQAAVCRRTAGQLGGEAEQVRTQTIPALLKEGRFARAYACDADRADVLRGMDRLVAFLPVGAEPLQDSTAAGPLKAAWGHIVRTAWPDASEALDAAARLDPVDARIPAYRALVAGGRGDQVARRQYLRAALALEEARARLMGTSFVTGNGVPLVVRDVALTLAVRLELARTDLAAGRAELALAACQLNIGLEARFDAFQGIELAPTALLPDLAANPEQIPAAPSLASLLAWSRLEAGRALVALNRPAEALDQYRLVRGYLSRWPATAPGRETLTVVGAWAQLGLAEATLATKAYDQARQMVLDQDLHAWGLPRELEQRVKAMQQQISEAQGRQFEAERAADARLTPRQLKVRSLRQDITAMKQQRDGFQAELNKPGVSEPERTVYRGSLQELDRAIARREAAAAQLEQAPDEAATTTPSTPRSRAQGQRAPSARPNP